ncbi:Hypothetical predicted protein [Pelobates cultripes]|uniref:Uncharacterized protein n=1 Tax=Pelobates cultripes TaxID=61616 RepID=A0AAD1RBB9_PELCU|nr:Hypothetical predicted protein [Pelobates cultripes]
MPARRRDRIWGSEAERNNTSGGMCATSPVIIKADLATFPTESKVTMLTELAELCSNIARMEGRVSAVETQAVQTDQSHRAMELAVERQGSASLYVRLCVEDLR